MKILYIAHRIPYPPNKGDKIRSFNEIKYLSQRHEIHLACLVDDPKDLKYVDNLKKYCKTVNVVLINPKLARLKGILYLFSKKPLSVPYFYSKKLQQTINHLLSTNNYDAILCFSSPMAEYVFRSVVHSRWSIDHGNKLSTIDQQPSTNNHQPATKIMDFVDVDSDKWLQYSKYTKFPYSWIYRLEAHRLARYEQTIAESFDHSIFVSKKEAELFQKQNPHIMNITAISNGVDLEHFNPELVDSLWSVANGDKLDHPLATNNHQPTTINQHPILLFTGAMDYFANTDGVKWFVSEVFPLIKREIPLAKFYIVGSRPTKEVRKLADHNGVLVTGFVEDIRKYLAKATIYVAPLRIARGIQNKILEAMAMGIPVVATPTAFEGIEAESGRDLIVEEDPEKFSHQVIKLLKGHDLKEYFRNNARKLTESNYSWSRNLKILESIISNRQTS